MGRILGQKNGEETRMSIIKSLLNLAIVSLWVVLDRLNCCVETVSGFEVFQPLWQWIAQIHPIQGEYK